MAQMAPLDVKVKINTEELSLKCNIQSLTDRMKKDSHFWHKKIHSNENHQELLTHYALGLCGEAGEVADEVKKMSYDPGAAARRVDLATELSDVLVYLLLLADLEDIDIIDAYLDKRQHNIARWGDPEDSLEC